MSRTRGTTRPSARSSTVTISATARAAADRVITVSPHARDDLTRWLGIPASKIRVTAGFDNSQWNPWNPDPSVPVTFGEQTFEEMMIGYLNYSAE